MSKKESNPEAPAARSDRPKPPPPPPRYFRDTLFGQVETKESIKAREDWYRAIGKW